MIVGLIRIFIKIFFLGEEESEGNFQKKAFSSSAYSVLVPRRNSEIRQVEGMTRFSTDRREIRELTYRLGMLELN